VEGGLGLSAGRAFGLALLLAGVCVLSACQRTPLTVTADRIVVEKAQRRLTLYRKGIPLRSYHVALGFEPVGPKTREGDGRTPEGVYRIDRRKPESGYHQSLHLSYPDAADRARAAALGVSPGGDVMIHGLRNGLGWLGPLHRLHDWTLGCIALTDAEVDEVAHAAPDGTPVEIRP
jgi:murein L,D-transpeptidase YafK